MTTNGIRQVQHLEMDESNEMFVVVSDLDGGAYGPFFILARAIEYAEVADGSVFKLLPAEADEGSGVVS